jgi:triosephosphate isomerase
MRRLVAGTGWKMNNGIADSIRYAEELKARIAPLDTSAIDIYVLPPFTSLAMAAGAFAGSQVAVGGQNMHWEDAGSWTGEISASMLLEAGCRYVELAHSERLQHFGETYELVRRKVDKAMDAGLIPVVCLGETAQEKAEGRSDQVLADQVLTSIDGQPDERIPEIILAYEPRWAIGAAEAASPDYVEARHRALRAILKKHCGEEIAGRTRIIYGGSVTPENGRAILDIEDVDGLFVGRAAWRPEGFARIVELVADAARRKQA